MKYTRYISFVLSIVISLFSIASQAYAATVNVNGYNYAHTNEFGKTNFKDNAGRNFLMGDFIQNDAKINWIEFDTSKISGGTLFIRYPDNTTQTVSNGYVVLNQTAKKVEIVLSKTTYSESLVFVKSYGTQDDSDGGTGVTYIYQKPPVTFGSLGNGNQPSDPKPDPDPEPTKPPTTGGGTDTGSGSGGGSTGGGSTGGGGIIGNDELNATMNDSCTVITWTKKPTGTTAWSVNMDGSISRLPASQMSYNIPSTAKNNTFDIRALDSNQNQLGKSVLAMKCAPPTDPGTGTDTGTDPGTGTDTGTGDSGATCNVCEQIKAALECPGWDDMMGDLTHAIEDAMPPPPDWDMVADKIGKATIDHLDDYMGDVPPVPSKSEIDQATEVPPPTFDTSTPSDELVPEVPDEYKKGKIEFSLTPTTEISTKDESVEFKILDPVDQSDEPGKRVIPGDPNNSSGDIKHPDKVKTGEAPEPVKEPSSPTPNPTPSTGSSSPGAVPSHSSGTLPTTGKGGAGAVPGSGSSSSGAVPKAGD